MRTQIIKSNHGSAMILALVIIIVLTTVCGAFLTGAQLHQKFILREAHKIQALYLAESAIEKCIWYLRGNEGHDYQWRPQNESIVVMDDFKANVTIQPWCGFLKVTAHADYRKQSETLQVLLGERFDDNNRDAITMMSNDPNNIVVAGKNRIIGNVTVGAGGVTSGTTKGKKFEGDKLVNGDINRSTLLEPVFFNPIFFQTASIEYQSKTVKTEDMLPQTFEGEKETDPSRLISEDDLVIQTEDTLFRHSRTIICGGDVRFTGNGTIPVPFQCISKQRITISDQVQLHNCILYADSGIIIENNARLSAQLISPSDIRIQDNAILEYPSAACCTGFEKNGQLTGQIEVLDQAMVQGTLILDIEDSKNNMAGQNQTLIHVAPSATVIGMIYCKGRTVFEGTLIGNISTDQFSIYDWPTTYINWLIDAHFDRTQLPKTFCRPLLFSESPELDIVNLMRIKHYQ